MVHNYLKSFKFDLSSMNNDGEKSITFLEQNKLFNLKSLSLLKYKNII